MQSLEYEINTLYTSQGQTPFTTLGFGLGTNHFERCIQKAILQVRMEGIGKEKRTAIFPKLVFTLKRGVNLEANDPNYDVKQLALECATKRMYPDVLSYDQIVRLTGSFKVPMGCRSFLQGWKDENGQEVNDGRMNLGVVTLNIPRIALEADGSLQKFWEIFEEKLAICKDALVYRVERCKEATRDNAPVLYHYGAFGQRLKDGEEVDVLFRNKRATVSLGYIGLYEAATAFFGPAWETNPEAKAFTLEIVKALKAHTDAWGDEYGYHFSVYATPSESLTDRFCKLDIENSVLFQILPRRNTIRIVSTTMCVKIQHHLKRLSSKKIILCILQVDSSITANIRCFVKIRRRWKPCGILPMTKLDTLERIRQSITAISAVSMENLLLQVKGSNAHNVRTIIRKRVMW